MIKGREEGKDDGREGERKRGREVGREGRRDGGREVGRKGASEVGGWKIQERLSCSGEQDKKNKKKVAYDHRS
jgi:hypothetical protein